MKNEKLDRAIQKVITDPFNALKGNQMADDNQKKIEEANKKIADANGGNVVGVISAFGTPSTYEDPNHPDSAAIGSVEADGPKQDERFEDDVASFEKSQEQAADEAIANAEAQVVQAEAEAKAKKSDK